MRKWMMVLALVTYLLSQVLPAFRMADTIVWGWGATALSFMVVPLSIGQGLSVDSAASLLGAAANVLFLATFVAAWTERKRLACVLAWSAAGCAMTVSAALCTNLQRGNPHVGCGLWLLSMLFLSMGTWDKVQTVKRTPWER
jgi:hypothetical protein